MTIFFLKTVQYSQGRYFLLVDRRWWGGGRALPLLVSAPEVEVDVSPLIVSAPKVERDCRY
jgi:hypothetical protein